MSRRPVRDLFVGGLPFRGYTGSWLAGQCGLAAGTAILISGFGYVVLAAGGLHVPFWQLWLVATSVLLLLWLLRTIAVPSARLPPAPAGAGEPADRPYRQAERWEHRLSTTAGDPDWFARVVQERVVALAAVRLWQRHGVRLTAEPDRARRVLGDELYDFLTNPVTRTPNPAELGRLTARIEEI